MNLRTIIDDKYKNALKAKNIKEINTFRLIKSAIKDKDIAFRSNEDNKLIGETAILSLLQSLIKQRKDSIDSFKLAGRNDLIVIEQDEIEIISQFLPKQLNERETEELVFKIIKEHNMKSVKDMGLLMSELKKNYTGTIDMALAGKIAKNKLS